MDEDKKLYEIDVDGVKHTVRLIVTGGQIKRLAGCDNEYYHVVILDPLDDWVSRGFDDLTDNEAIDLGRLVHDKKELKFSCEFEEPQSRRNRRIFEKKKEDELKKKEELKRRVESFTEKKIKIDREYVIWKKIEISGRDILEHAGLDPDEKCIYNPHGEINWRVYQGVSGPGEEIEIGLEHKVDLSQIYGVPWFFTTAIQTTE